MQRQTFFLGLVSITLVLTASGCGGGPDMAPVTGTVLLDGSPLAGASVAFTPNGGGRAATGTTDESGQFQLTTFEQNDGALVGEHSVSVSLMRYEKKTGRNQNVVRGLDSQEYAGKTVPVWVVPERYIRPDTSGIKVTVPCPDDSVTLELTSD